MDYHQLSQLRPEERLVGTKQVLRGITEKTLRCVVVASDADSFIVDTVVGEAKANGVAVSFVGSKIELGKACGVKIGAACVGLLKQEQK